MRKNYLSPKMEILECECTGMIAASSEQIEDGGTIPLGSRAGNGSWDNIWSN